MVMEGSQSFKVICSGGLNSNQNYLDLSENYPGAATELINFEPSLFGGYRRLSGFADLNAAHDEVDPSGAEGPILGIMIFGEDIYAARKQQAGATYKIYKYSAGSAWAAQSPGFTFTSTGVTKLRYDTFNFNGTEMLIFVDGVNFATIFDGTTWTQIKSTATGANFANAGGPQAIDTPKYVKVFENHIFLAGDAADPHIVAHSSPNAEYDWLSANGAGQINAAFDIKQIFPFREELFVFGMNKISKIFVDASNFVIKNVTTNVGCLASDSVLEINGDILFLSQDGFRTIAGTDKIGDVEISVMSKNIQQDVIELIDAGNLDAINAVVVRKKSQVRFFFSDENVDTSINNGILGCIVREGGHQRGLAEGLVWEWSKILGIRTSCATSDYIGGQEFVLHGDFNGKVYQQESGNSFDGASVSAVYTTPYFDMGDVFVRKTIRRVKVFMRLEGSLDLNAAMQFDWDSSDAFNPSAYNLTEDVTGALYDSATYDSSTYAEDIFPVRLQNLEGSGYANKLTFFSEDTNAPYGIYGFVFEATPNGRK